MQFYDIRYFIFILALPQTYIRLWYFLLLFLENVTKYTFQHKSRYWAINTIFIGLQTSYVHDVNIINPFIVITIIFYAIFPSQKKKKTLFLKGRESFVCMTQKRTFPHYLNFACDSYRQKQIHTQSSFLPRRSHKRVRIFFPIINLCSRSIDTYKCHHKFFHHTLTSYHRLRIDYLLFTCDSKKKSERSYRGLNLYFFRVVNGMKSWKAIMQLTWKGTLKQ